MRGKIEGPQYTSIKNAQEVLSTTPSPFEFFLSADQGNEYVAVVSFRTQALEPYFGIGRTPRTNGESLDQLTFDAVKRASGDELLEDAMLLGGFIDLTSREHVVNFLDASGSRWVTTGPSFREAVTDGLAAVVAERAV